MSKIAQIVDLKFLETKVTSQKMAYFAWSTEKYSVHSYWLIISALLCFNEVVTSAVDDRIVDWFSDFEHGDLLDVLV